MLQRFETINFKSFNDHLVLDLSASNYAYSKSSVENGIIKTALIYGQNASGKTNIGLAIFDIINSITNKESSSIYQSNYSCLLNDSHDVYFKYQFKFNKSIVVYEYIKSNFETLLYEKLIIDGKTALQLYRKESYDRKWEKSNHDPIRLIGEARRNVKPDVMETSLKGAETLHKFISNPNLSVISYIKTNANLDNRNPVNRAFRDLVYFVDHMLWFRSVENNSYIGLITGSDSLDAKFSKSNDLPKLQSFLENCGISCNLGSSNNRVVQIFPDGKTANFFDIASSGTKALALLCYWSLALDEHKGRFLFIDEFDSTFHTLLAKSIVAMLKKTNVQVLLTSHNTNLMSNDVLRPDAYFLLQNNAIKSMDKLTDKELREVHNLEKLYLANTFVDETE